MFFNDWLSLARVVVVGALAYLALVLALRASGKRTLSKMNAFDLIVTVALGSTLATVVLSKDVTLAEGIVAFLLLIGMQYVITWCSVRSKWFENLVKSEPSLLYFEGRFLEEVLRRERLTPGEVRAAVRAQGYANLADAGAVVLETDGSLTVLKRQPTADYSALEELTPSPHGEARNEA